VTSPETFVLEADCSFEAADLDDAMRRLSQHFLDAIPSDGGPEAREEAASRSSSTITGGWISVRAMNTPRHHALGRPRNADGS